MSRFWLFTCYVDSLNRLSASDVETSAEMLEMSVS